MQYGSKPENESFQGGLVVVFALCNPFSNRRLVCCVVFLLFRAAVRRV